MKKRHTALFLAIVLLLTTLCACGQQAGQAEQSESSGEEPTKGLITREPAKPSSEQSKEIAITELYSEEGEGTSDDGFSYKYSFHVPQIEDNTADAADINQEIASTYGEIAKECLRSIKKKEAPYCSSVEYESFYSGEILSLVLKCAYFYDGFEGYTVYSYDTAKGMRLTNEDILKMQNITETDYLTALRRAVAQDFDDAYHAGWRDMEDIYSGGYQELRSWTLSEQNLNLDLPLYLDDGTVHIIAPIGSIAGSEYLSQDLALELGEDSDHVETTQLGDYLTVKRKGDIVTLRVQQTPRLETLLGEDGLINVDTPLYDKNLTVNGLYGSYTKIVCGEIGEADEPFVFLLTKEGRVDCIDILPELIIPFFITQEEARERMLEWGHEHESTPEGRSIVSSMGRFQGYYLPYYLIRGPVYGTVTRDGNNRIYSCAGYLEGTAVNLSKQMDNLTLDGITPFDWSAARPFEYGYITGHHVKLSDISDTETDHRIREKAAEDFLPEVERFMQSSGVCVQVETGNISAVPTLLPVYFIKSGKLTVVMNGQTGRIAVSQNRKKKSNPWVIEPLVYTMLAAGLLSIPYHFEFESSVLFSFVFAAIFFPLWERAGIP